MERRTAFAVWRWGQRQYATQRRLGSQRKLWFLRERARVITAPLTAEGASLVLSDAVVEHFALYQQVRQDQADAGGQLFARITRYEIFVEEASIHFSKSPLSPVVLDNLGGLH